MENIKQWILLDYLKHPIAVKIRGRLSESVKSIEPHAVQLGQYLQKQGNLLLKYIEGPVYDKTVEMAEQVGEQTVRNR